MMSLLNLNGLSRVLQYLVEELSLTISVLQFDVEVFNESICMLFVILCVQRFNSI